MKTSHLVTIVSFAILVFGLVMLASVSSVISYERFGTSTYYLSHQVLLGLLPGIVLWLVLAKADYHYLEKWAFLLLVISIIFLVLVFFPGVGVELRGAKRWLNFGFVFQPTEVLKLTFVIYLAAWLTRCVRENRFLFTSFLVILGVVSFLIILQPDVGTLSVIIALAVGMYFVAGAPLWQIMSIFLIGLSLFALLIKIAPYRLQRLMVFFNSDLDPQGIGYQISQAFMAVGTGGFLGVGFGQSLQKYSYLPEVVGDSIFAVIAEELGFLRIIVLVGLFLVLSWIGFKIARNAKDNFGRLMATGITIWIAWQAFVNMGAMVGILPLTGIPLPFVSYGGTALVVTLAGVGILTNIASQSE